MEARRHHPRMEDFMRTVTLSLLLIVFAIPAAAQNVIPPPPVATKVSLSGPRFGITTLSDQMVAKLSERNIDVNPVISQFGWQFEKQFYAKDSDIAVVNEWVVLLGGLEQGVAIPSLSWMVGMRTNNGTEFGVGPNVTAGGVALAIAAGMTMRTRGPERPDECGGRAVQVRHACQLPDGLQRAEVITKVPHGGATRRFQTRVHHEGSSRRFSYGGSSRGFTPVWNLREGGVSGISCVRPF